jgi:hypothetical protein
MPKHRLAAATVLVAAVCAALATAAVAARGGSTTYEFRGDLAATTSSSVRLTVDGGNHDALKALLGQSQDQTFAISGSTRVEFEHGRHTSVAELHAGDQVIVRVKAPKGSTLAQIEAQPASLVLDRQRTARMAGPLFLYVGTVTGAQPSGHVALHVTSGNWRALHTMLGQSLDQTFTTGDATIFLLWQNGHATVIQPSQLQAGDPITIRVHAAASSSLSQVEATVAAHVGDHEPGNPESQS